MVESWEKTVMSPQTRSKLVKEAVRGQIVGTIEPYLLKAQAKLTWDARQSEVDEAEKRGMRKVVEWMNNNGIIYSVYWRFPNEKWQAQLRTWFKDEPELLESWGIEEKHEP